MSELSNAAECAREANGATDDLSDTNKALWTLAGHADRIANVLDQIIAELILRDGGRR